MFDPCFGKCEAIKVKRELEFSILSRVCSSLPQPQRFLLVKLVLQGVFFDLFCCLGQPAPSNGRKEEIASALRTSCPSLLATRPTTHKHYLESRSHHVIPATSLQIFRNDTFPDSSLSQVSPPIQCPQEAGWESTIYVYAILHSKHCCLPGL